MEKVYAAKHVTLLIYIYELPYSFNASDGSSDKWQMVQNAVVQEYCYHPWPYTSAVATLLSYTGVLSNEFKITLFCRLFKIPCEI
jgi:hypothetical protein